MSDPAFGALERGAMIDGKYAVERVLGEGGMGVIYLARDVHAEAPVVLKAIRAAHVARADFRDRILAEGRALARIDHPNIVRLNAIVVEPSGNLYLVMQFIEGESLDVTLERLAREGRRMDVGEALRVFEQVLDGIAAVHREGIIHRDIKPANILVRARDGAVKVTDFGIAKPEEDAKEGRGQTQGVIGSVLYMSPEQCRGLKLDKRVDIYALGIVLFELLAGRPPFSGPSAFEVMTMQVKAPLPSLVERRPDVPAFVGALLAKACAKEPDDRFPSCEAFLEALRAAMASPPETTAPAAPLFAAPSPAAPVEQRSAPLPSVAASAPVPEAALATSALGAPKIPAPPAPARREEKPRAPVALVGGALVAVIAVGALYAKGFAENPKESAASSPSQSQAPPPSAPASSGSASIEPLQGASLGSPAEPPPPARLVGVWKSDSGRIYDVAPVGDAFEFRVRDPAQFAGQEYVASEPRLVLRPAPGELDVFLVEDRIRPLAPDGSSFDPERSRETCRVVRSDVSGRPLRAELDGDRLRVRMAKIAPKASMFQTERGKIVGCSGLSDAPATEIDSTLTKQPR